MFSCCQRPGARSRRSRAFWMAVVSVPGNVRSCRKRNASAPSGLQPKHLDPDTLDIEELKQRFLVVQAQAAA